MAAHKQTPWWELESKLPHNGPVDAERERLRSELARAWRSHLANLDGDPSQTLGPPSHSG
jgi:hypothetical protein